MINWLKGNYSYNNSQSVLICFAQKMKLKMPHLETCFFLIFYNEPELGAEIDPGMALTPLPSSIGLGANPQPSDCEPIAQPLDHSFCYPWNTL